MTQPTPNQTTVGDILREIEKMAGADSANLPILQRYTWFADPGGRPTVFSFSQPSPIGGDKGYRVWGLFRRIEEEEVSVYLLWGGGESKDEKPTPPMRYVLDTTNPNYGAEAMSFDKWKEEFAAELSALETGVTTPLAEREAICAYLTAASEELGLAPPVVEALTALIEEIDDGDHLEDGDSEDEPEVPAPNGAAPEVAKSTPGPTAG